MFCEKCGQRPATVQYTVILNGRGKQTHLCAQCAGESGVAMQFPEVFSGDMFAAPRMGGWPFGSGASPFGFAEDFPAQIAGQPASRKSGGFDRELAPLLRKRDREGGAQALQRELEQAVAAEDYERAARLQKQLRAEQIARPADTSAEILELQRELTAAVAAEDYEKAARLRDEIRSKRAS